jgi:hypothetical protein
MCAYRATEVAQWLTAGSWIDIGFDRAGELLPDFLYWAGGRGPYELCHHLSVLGDDDRFVLLMNLVDQAEALRLELRRSELQMITGYSDWSEGSRTEWAKNRNSDRHRKLLMARAGCKYGRISVCPN